MSKRTVLKPFRGEAFVETAAKVAAFLAAHPKIEKVFHPSRPDHPDAAIIARETKMLDRKPIGQSST